MVCSWQSDLEKETSVADSQSLDSNLQVLQKVPTDPQVYGTDSQFNSLARQFI